MFRNGNMPRQPSGGPAIMRSRAWFLPTKLSHTYLQIWPHISKTQRSINFRISTYIQQHKIPVTWPNSGGIGQRSRSHGHIMYTAVMCRNSVTGDPIKFILAKGQPCPVSMLHPKMTYIVSGATMNSTHSLCANASVNRECIQRRIMKHLYCD